MAKLLDLQEELHIAKGLYSNRHPRVKGLSKALDFSQQQLHNSLSGEMAGVRASIKLKKRQLAGLKDRIEKLKARLIRLSKARSEHLALTTQSQQLGEAATRAKTVWTEIESRTKTARTVGLLTPTDVAQVSTRPDGVGKKVIALAGLLGGLMTGVGLMFIVAPPMTDPTSTNNASDRNNSTANSYSNWRFQYRGQLDFQCIISTSSFGNAVGSQCNATCSQ